MRCLVFLRWGLALPAAASPENSKCSRPRPRPWTRPCSVLILYQIQDWSDWSTGTCPAKQNGLAPRAVWRPVRGLIWGPRSGDQSTIVSCRDCAVGTNPRVKGPGHGPWTIVHAGIECYGTVGTPRPSPWTRPRPSPRPRAPVRVPVRVPVGDPVRRPVRGPVRVKY